MLPIPHNGDRLQQSTLIVWQKCTWASIWCSIRFSSISMGPKQSILVVWQQYTRCHSKVFSLCGNNSHVVKTKYPRGVATIHVRGHNKVFSWCGNNTQGTTTNYSRGVATIHKYFDMGPQKTILTRYPAMYMDQQ